MARSSLFSSAQNVLIQDGCHRARSYQARGSCSSQQLNPPGSRRVKRKKKKKKNSPKTCCPPTPNPPIKPDAAIVCLISLHLFEIVLDRCGARQCKATNRRSASRRRRRGRRRRCGSDDLLPLVLLRLGFPTSLVRAALVCRRWYRIASHPDFLRRFRELHPPGVLGFYSDLVFSTRPQFVPLVEVPELATVIRRASALNRSMVISDCRHGRLLVSCLDGPRAGDGLVLHPLHPTRGVAVVPQLPHLTGHLACLRAWFFLPEDASEDGAIVVEVFLQNRRFRAEVSTFQSGTWTNLMKVRVHDLGTEASHSVEDVLPPVHGKIYMKTSSPSYILELDLVEESVSVIQLPERVNTNNYKISCGEELGLSLVHADSSVLSIWHLRMSDDGSCDWDLVDDVICVREAYNRQDDVTVFLVDSNLEYVFLGLNATHVLISMHLKSRTEKVLHYGKVRSPNLSFRKRIVPLMMVWPPIFPAWSEENL